MSQILKKSYQILSIFDMIFPKMGVYFLRKNYFLKLVKYIKNVYQIEKSLKRITDGRINPTYNTFQVVLPVLLGFILRIRSFNELNNMIKDNEFRNVVPNGVKLPKIDSIRDTLKVIDIIGLREVIKFVIKKARKNKVFEKGTIDGLVVAAMDGTQTFNSDNKSCKNCLKSFKKGKIEYRNSHSGVVLSTIGEGAKLVVDFEQYKPGEDSVKKDEGELTVAKRLLKRVVENHNGLIDVLVYDAIACNSEWINACIKADLSVVVRMKNNNIDSVRKIRKKVNKSEAIAIWTNIKDFESVKVYEETFWMKNVDRKLRFVKYLMTRHDGKHSQIMIVTTCMEMELITLFRIIRARQNIENSIFHNLKTECGLEHCYVHGGNSIEAVLCLIFITSNFIQLFYHRRIKKSVQTQVELVRLLLKGLYLLKKKPDVVFSTG